MSAIIKENVFYVYIFCFSVFKVISKTMADFLFSIQVETLFLIQVSYLAVLNLQTHDVIIIPVSSDAFSQEGRKNCNIVE